MSEHLSRRAFLRGRTTEELPLRPPGALVEAQFHDLCTRCGDCIQACPETVIRPGSDGRPVLDPTLGACTFCGDCSAACQTGALVADRPWPWRAAMEKNCLSLNAVHCRTCQDHCDEGAIGFRLLIGGRALPEADPETCTGCGGCIAPCPVGAITLKRHPSTPELHPC